MLEDVVSELKKEKADIIRMNEDMREKYTDLLQTASDLRTRAMNLENEKSSLMTALKLIQQDNMLSNKRNAELQSQNDNLIAATKLLQNDMLQNDIFKEKVSESKNNTKELWNLIKCLSKDDADRRAVITNLTENTERICDQKTIAEILNNFFVEQPQNLIADLENATLLDSLPTIGQNSSEFEIPFISQKGVAEILLSIPSHKATGNDGISAKLLKIAAPGIIPSLTKLLNHCLHTKTFPNVWKVAKVTPVFKGNGSKDDKNNYRPMCSQFCQKSWKSTFVIICVNS